VRQRAATNANCTPNILRLMDEKASTASMLLCKRPSHRYTRTLAHLHPGTHTHTPMQVHKGSARPLQKGRNAIGNGQEV